MKGICSSILPFLILQVESAKVAKKFGFGVDFGSLSTSSTPLLHSILYLKLFYSTPIPEASVFW